VRWKWAPGSVAFWDNRVVAHRAVPGGYNPEEREGKRTAIFGERPFRDLERGVRLGEYVGKPAHVDVAGQNGLEGTNGTGNETLNGSNGLHYTNGTTELSKSNVNVGP